MLTVADIFKNGFLAEELACVPKCDLPCTEHEGETRRKSNCERNTPKTLPVERGGKMDSKNNFGG